MQSFPELPFTALTNLGDAAARTLVLTVNNRHARRLLADLAAFDAARPVRQTPHILPLSAWLQQAADALPETDIEADADNTSSGAPPMAAHVLDAFGACELWAQVIAREEPQRELLDTRQAARLAQEADALVVDWQLHVSASGDAASLETARFVQWRRAYLARLQELDALDFTRLTEAVLRAAAHGVLPLPFDVVVLSGFTELPPAVYTLLGHMQRQGRRVVRLDVTTPRATYIARSSTPTHEAQWRAAAAWAARRVREQPTGRFAIVAAQLETDMPFAHRVLGQALGNTPYNMAVARPLNEWPPVRAALAWLRVVAAYAQPTSQTASQTPDPGCEPAVVGAALLAGACAGHAQETHARAALDARWRHYGFLRLPADTLAQQLTEYTPTLARAWQDARSAAHQHGNRPAPLDAWIAHFRDVLRRLGFPGTTLFDSTAWQTLQAFDLALARAAGQAFAFGDISRQQALGILERLIAQTRFQPMRDPNARVDVLGLLEAEGGRWDAVWVLGLHDGNFPAAPRPNPLLPAALLRDAGTPRATLARELQWAHALRDALLCCAPCVLFSHAQQDGDAPLRASPLLADMAEIDLEQAVDGAWEENATFTTSTPDTRDTTPAAPVEAVQLETLLDAQGPPLSATRKPLRGGIGVIDTQARNPLWAFVKYRLGANQLPDYANAADSRPRGTFLHHCIELVWRLLPDQAALQKSWEQGRLPGLIKQAAAHAAEKHLHDLGPTLQGLEIARAEQILHDWLALERTRAPFRVHGVEQTVCWRDGPLELRLRIDRVDMIADGSLAVIDYKTGASSIAVRGDWMRNRPINVQLPFYAAMPAHTHPVAALILVKLHARGIELRGVARDPDIKGIESPRAWPPFENKTWDEVMQHWRTAIQTIAREIAEGAAENVTRHTNDLQYCDALPFLRIHDTVPPGDAHVAR